MKRNIQVTAMLLFAGIISACSGGASTTEEPAQVTNPPAVVATKATVGIVLTDAAVDDYDHAWVTITSIELLGGDDGHQLIFSGEERVDLLALRDTVELFAVSEDVEPGDISKIRLQAKDMQLVVDNDDDTTTVTDVDLVANGKIDLNPRQTITLAAGDVVFVSLDWDMNESLKLTETGNGRVIMRPVIFVDIDTEPGFKEGLVRVFGLVASVAPDDSAFRLCSPDITTQQPSTPVLGALCLDIVMTGKTGIFNAKGIPMMVSELGVKDPITVLGLLRRAMDGATVTTMLDTNGGDFAPTTFQVLAIVGEGGPEGTWARYKGQLESAVDAETGAFEFEVGTVSQEMILNGQLFESSRIFSISGDTGVTEISAAELAKDDRAAVDAVMLPPDVETDPNTLNIAIMMSRDDVDLDNIAGTVLSVNADAGTMMIATSAGDACVTTDINNTQIFQIFVSDDSVESMPAMLGDLIIGSKVGATGEQLDCFAADLIISEGQASIPQ